MYGGVTVPICYFVVELLGIRIETLNAKKKQLHLKETICKY